MKQKIKFKQTEIGMIPEDWEVKQLKELIFVKGRIGWKGLKKSEFGNEGVIIINGPEIKNGKVNWKYCQRVPKWRYDESQEIDVKQNDVIMTKDGTIGKTAYIEYLPEPATLASGIFLIRTKSEKLDQRFLYQYFNSMFFKNLVESRIEGSVIPHLYQRDIELLSIPIPNISEQVVIAKILSDLDSKIELNQQMNKTLEAIGQAIFKHWFVDFEFPNEKGKPYKSSGGEMVNSELGKIPKGWKVGKFKDISRLQMGISPKGDSYNEDGKGIPLLNGAADFSGKLILPKKFTTEPIKKCNSGDLVFCIRATIGNVTFADKEFCLGRGVAALKINNDFREFFYYSLIGSLEKMISSATGSVIIGLSKTDIEDRKIIIPDDKLIKYFNKNLFSFFEMQKWLDEEIQSLSQIRDSLLPKLMSGKIRVPVEVRK